MMSSSYPGDELALFATATNWKAYLGALLASHVGGRVMEVGAGIGATTEALLNEHVERWLCLEPDQRLADRCARRIVDLRVTVAVGTIADVPLDRSFDTILYIDVLEHVPDDVAELHHAARHLAPLGKLVILSPAYEVLTSAFDRAIGHHRRYDKRSLAAAVPPFLRRDRLFYCDSVGALLSLANRLMLHQSRPSAAQIGLWDRFVVPLSTHVDQMVRYSFGRSVIAIYHLPEEGALADHGGARSR